MTLFSRPTFFLNSGGKSEDGRDRLGYNHGEECRRITVGDIEKVKSRKAYSKYAESKL